MGTTAQQTTLNALQLDAGMGWYQFLFLESFENNIVANPGGGQANAYQLTKQNNRITTVATSGDSVKLPIATPGAEVILINHGANSAQVFGVGTDTINDVASGTGVPMMQMSAVLFLCFSAGAWYTEGLANGFTAGFQTFSSQDNLVAHAGGGQALATPLTAMQNFLGTVTTAADSVLLPPAKPGMQIDVINKTANAAATFPSTGETINGGAANASVALPTGTAGANPTTLFFCGTAGAWWSK
jgi:hypothetical protein